MVRGDEGFRYQGIPRLYGQGVVRFHGVRRHIAPIKPLWSMAWLFACSSCAGGQAGEVQAHVPK